MSLSSLAPDAISILTDLLRSHEVFRLCLTGDKVLQAKIRQTWRNLDLEISWNPRRAGLASLIRLISHFSAKPQRLVLNERHSGSLNIDRGGPEWALLPPSLVELTLGYNQPAFTLHQLTLAQLWPNLQTLVVPSMDEALWLSLPQNLVSLTSSNTERQYADSIFEHLPISLRKLVIHSVVKSKSQSALDLRHLPLETLSLQLKIKGPLSWHCFPPTVTSLSVTLHSGESSPPEVAQWSILFPALSTLEVSPESLRSTATGHFAMLPDTLTALTVHHGGSRDIEVDLAPVIAPIRSQLRQVTGYQLLFHDLPEYAELDAVKLVKEQQAEVFDCTAAFSPQHKIRSLTMGELSPDSLALLPPTLVSLSFLQMTAAGVDYVVWPQSLESLSISSHFALNQLNLDHFPASLTTLSLAASCYLRYLRKGTIRHLTKLVTLNLCSYFKGGVFFKSASELPPNLQEINCEKDDDQGAISEMIFTEQPGTLPNKLLEIHLGSVQRRLDLLQYLPVTLRRLTMHANHSEIWAEYLIRSLPPALEVLKAPGAKGWLKNTAKPLRFLPRSLRVLDIATRVKPNDFERHVPICLACLEWQGSPMSTQYMLLCDERAHEEVFIESRCASSEISDDSTSASTESPRALHAFSSGYSASSASTTSAEFDTPGSAEEAGSDSLSPGRKASSSVSSAGSTEKADKLDKSDEKPAKSSKPSLWERFSLSKSKKKKSKKNLE